MIYGIRALNLNLPQASKSSDLALNSSKLIVDIIRSYTTESRSLLHFFSSSADFVSTRPLTDITKAWKSPVVSGALLVAWAAMVEKRYRLFEMACADGYDRVAVGCRFGRHRSEQGVYLDVVV